jgi:hypothetical protein
VFQETEAPEIDRVVFNSVTEEITKPEVDIEFTKTCLNFNQAHFLQLIRHRFFATIAARVLLASDRQCDEPSKTFLKDQTTNISSMAYN